MLLAWVFSKMLAVPHAHQLYQTLKQGNIIFGRLDRIKRKQGVSNS